MAIKRYQIAILSFALGIFSVTSAGVFLIRRFSEEKPVAKETPREYRSVQAFFSNSIKDPNTLYCDKTYSVERIIDQFSDSERGRLGELTYLAVSELLKGPTEAEKQQGFFTLINEGTKIQKIFIEQGVVTADFNGKLNEGVAGSCVVQTIRSQITQTLMQFPEIKEVVISVNGETEEILQP